jgi:hypothetical protein
MCCMHTSCFNTRWCLPRAHVSSFLAHILLLLFRAYTLPSLGAFLSFFLLRRLGWGGGRVGPYVLSRAALGEMALGRVLRAWARCSHRDLLLSAHGYPFSFACPSCAGWRLHFCSRIYLNILCLLPAAVRHRGSAVVRGHRATRGGLGWAGSERRQAGQTLHTYIPIPHWLLFVYVPCLSLLSPH